MNKSLFVFLLFFVFQFVICQKIDPKKLNLEISELNDIYKYDESIIRLEEIISNPKYSDFDRYNAYLQKALTYKRLYNYPEVLQNLDYALEEAKQTNFWEAAEVRVLTEQMFVEFDSKKYEEARKLIGILALKNINLLNSESLGFYFSAAGVLQIIDKKYEDAERTFNKAITILKKNDPKHLPMIYSKIISLAEHLEDKEMAQNAFKRGMFYADEYKMDMYRISLYYTMSHFFMTLEDYKSAYLYENQGVEVSSRYNAAFQNGKLTVLEKTLLKKKKNEEIKVQRQLKLFFILLSLVTLALVVVLYKLYYSNKQKNTLIQNENSRMRSELEMRVSSEKKEQININNGNLTERQLEIIDLVRQHKTNKEIGNELHISENTVKYHLKTIYNVLGIENRFELKQ